MREIELKFKIDNPNEIIDFLKEKGSSFGEKKYQYDTVYVKSTDHIEQEAGSVFLRVRATDDKIKITYKKRSSKVGESQEIEFGVDSYELANEFTRMGSS